MLKDITHHLHNMDHKHNIPATYTSLPPRPHPPSYTPLPSNLPFAPPNPGVTPHSITVHERNLKYLEKHKEDEHKRAHKFSNKSNKEKARAEKHYTKATLKAEEGHEHRAMHHERKAVKLSALSKIHHKVALESRSEFMRAKALTEEPPRPTLPPQHSGRPTM